jgi:glyoxylase-like metal-dependent hydrolase (beta-lactamase superfamily II)
MSYERVTRLRLVNVYLVREDDGLTLIDTMIPRSAPFILRAAERLGAPIRRILITHAHPDHIGSLDALAAALPDAEVLYPARDARLLAGDRSIDPGEPHGKLKPSQYRQVKTRPTRTLTEGDRVGSLEVHAAPGHSPGQIALLDTRDRTLFCADAFHTVGGVSTSARPSLPFPLPALASWDRPMALLSARALRALDPAALAPGHGKVVRDPGAAMDAAIARGA